MFDDCKGEKFERLLVAVSTLAILKSLEDDRSDGSIAKRLLVSKTLADPEVTLPLTLAYRVSLNARVREKRKLTQNYIEFRELLEFEQARIDRRRADLTDRTANSTHKEISERGMQRLKTHMATNWTGDQRWIDLLIHGDRNKPDNSLLERKFDGIWPLIGDGSVQNVVPNTNESLLQDLEGRVVKQNSRLERWKKIQEDLVIQSARNISPSAVLGHSSPQSTPLARSSPAKRNGYTAVAHVRKSKAVGSEHRATLLPDSFSSISNKEPSATNIQLLEAPSRDSLRASHTFQKNPTQYTDKITNPPQQQSIPSLAERTRMSMAALSSPQRTEEIPPNTRSSFPSPSPAPEKPDQPIPALSKPLQPISTAPKALARSASLLERTRHSMALMSSKPKRPREPKREVYPTNPFESPGQQYSSARDPGHIITEGDLPALDTVYEHVFQSRPKIASSPVLQLVQVESSDLDDMNRDSDCLR